MAGSPQASARIRIVGQLRVERGDVVHDSVALGSRKARLALALLAAVPGRAGSAAEIAEVLWPDGAPDSAEATVASLISRLRRTVGADLIGGGRAGYRVGPHVEVDLARAADLTDEAERRLAAAAPALAASAGLAALTLLAGTPLEEFADADWVHAVRTRHSALLRRARAATGHARCAVGEPGPAVALARAALADDPLDEEAARVLMTALGSAGEPAAALKVFAALRERLADELGTYPAPATAAVHADLLRGSVPTTGRAQPGADPGALVGREPEFAELSAAWAAAAAGTGSLVLITGEPGAGKTRLAEELVRLATETGATVLSTRCYEAERALFLQPFVEAVTAVVTHRPPALVLAAAAQHLDSLARLVPAVGALVERAPVDFSRAEVERRRAVEAMSGFLCGLARDHPVLLVLDDLHNAGASSLELLHFLRTVLPTVRLLVVATVRTDEGSETLTSLGAVATRVPVGPLPVAAVRRLAADAGQAHRADEIAQRTGGHALFVAEILRSPAAEIPTSLQAAVLARAARIGAPAEAMLRAGAVMGASFDPRLAAELAGLSSAQGLAACERALQDGLLRTAGRSYEFSNDLVREVLYATTPTPTRLAHHARSLDLLSGAPEQVAAHAEAIEDWPRAARAWLVAAEDAVHSFAAGDGEALAGRALASAQRCGDLELTARALVVRGQARDALAEYPAALADFTAAVEAAREAGDRREEMTALRELAGNVVVALGEPPATTEEPLRRCLRLAEGLGARTTEVDVLGRLAVLAITRLDFTAALDLSERGLRVARSSSEARAYVLALDARKSCYAYLGDVARLHAVIDELEPLIRRSGDLWLLQWTVFESALIPLAHGDYGAAIERIEAALAICRRTGYTPFEAFFIAHLAWVHRLAGDLDTALVVGAGAVAAAREFRHAWWQTTAAAMHGCTLVQAGRADEATTILGEIRASVEVPGAQAYLARCLGPLAESTGALTVLRRADELLAKISAPTGSAWLGGADAYLCTARAWRAQGESERAAKVLAPFVAAARRVGWRDLVAAAEAVLQ